MQKNAHAHFYRKKMSLRVCQILILKVAAAISTWKKDYFLHKLGLIYEKGTLLTTPRKLHENSVLNSIFLLTEIQCCQLFLWMIRWGGSWFMLQVLCRIIHSSSFANNSSLSCYLLFFSLRGFIPQIKSITRGRGRI